MIFQDSDYDGMYKPVEHFAIDTYGVSNMFADVGGAWAIIGGIIAFVNAYNLDNHFKRSFAKRTFRLFDGAVEVDEEQLRERSEHIGKVFSHE